MSGHPEPRAPAYRRLSVDERRAQLIATALRLFARNTPEDVSLDDVARLAEVSRPLVYRYFPGGKQQLYEAALQHAADRLAACFEVPAEGALSERLGYGLDRYLAFVREHGEGFTALLRGGSVVETARTTAIVDGVRRSAARAVLSHMAVASPGPWLRTAVRSWISTVEAMSLISLDEGELGLTELRDYLVDLFVGQLMVTATHDRQTARMLRAAAELEPPDGRVAGLLDRALRAVAPQPAGS
ncbi:TetR family transcriptional regulator [Streptomyces sp. 3MP-14]|uniref:TetR family transcriptional regulator n=1 Tax=Streptomyces mimosae TaxID=2586635 RepID=A0A5N6AS90_9ACTN|nr:MULTISPECIES: TetR/AcrR family transcriptional regulator [Streptomyces]KAB8171035.1 TetR family transcriptional regulator [Streptomyces mimosae]KAB8179614.1 TetR family transcriptional regulator [Streptomyces sp. 3MP-14]